MDYVPNSAWENDKASFETRELVLIARSMIVARQSLRGSLPVELIHDSALDLLLHFFVEQVASNHIGMDDALAMTTVPPRIVARWITVLESYGLIQHRESYIELSLHGFSTVRDTLVAVAKSQWAPSDERR